MRGLPPVRQALAPPSPQQRRPPGAARGLLYLVRAWLRERQRLTAPPSRGERDKGRYRGGTGTVREVPGRYRGGTGGAASAAASRPWRSLAVLSQVSPRAELLAGSGYQDGGGAGPLSGALRGGGLRALLAGDADGTGLAAAALSASPPPRLRRAFLAGPRRWRGGRWR